MAGYIKLHRKLLDSYQFSNPNNLKIWIWMLLKASHKKRIISVKVSQGYTDVTIERGQFIFGRNKAEIELDLDSSLIYRTLKVFEKDGSIIVKSNNQYSVVTICKYDDYNCEENESEQPVSSQRTASEQPVNTDKKDKKVKNVKEVFIVPSSQEVFDFFVSKGHRGEVGVKAHEYYSLANWKDKNGNAVKNWKQKMISVWMKEDTKIQKVVEIKRTLVH